MHKILRTIAIILLCGAMCAPCADARGRNNNSDRPERQHNTRPAHNGANRNDRNRGHNSRPGNGNKHGDNKHGNDKHGHGHNNSARPPQRPGNNGGFHNDNRRPPQHHDRPNRPGGHTRPTRPPQHHNNYGHHHGHHNVHFGRPHRPYMPHHRPFHRPTPPPPAWRPHAWRPFHSILGVALGSAINISINALINSGYDVCGYDNNAVYLSNVPMLNYYWPDANLYYSNGGLYGSEFVYSTPGYNMSRYNAVYNSLIGAYGAPYNVQTLTGGGRRATWWGNDGQFITLTFGGSYASAGGLRYFTTLSFGR